VAKNSGVSPVAPKTVKYGILKTTLAAMSAIDNISIKPK
jgi:hypothetical protein